MELKNHNFQSFPHGSGNPESILFYFLLRNKDDILNYKRDLQGQEVPMKTKHSKLYIEQVFMNLCLLASPMSSKIH